MNEFIPALLVSRDGLEKWLILPSHQYEVRLYLQPDLKAPWEVPVETEVPPQYIRRYELYEGRRDKKGYPYKVYREVLEK